MITPEFLASDSNAIADYIHPGKYARYLPEQKRREVFSETVSRVEEMHVRRYPYMEASIRWAFDMVRQKKVLPSMRSMQFGGKAIEVNHARLYNCSFSLCDRPRFFQEALFLLLSGVGVGYSVQFDHVEKLPPVAYMNTKVVKHHIVKDTIEGWSDALGALVNSYFKTGVMVEFAYHQIRQEGEALVTSGGRAPGHRPLRKALDKIRHILHQAQGRQLRPIECHQIMCHAADAVLSGGIRRSAMIALFSLEDGEMMSCKTGKWNETHPEYANANNSVMLNRHEIKKSQFKRIFQKTREWGEPGFYFADDMDSGANPCVEIGLNPVLTITEDIQALIAQTAPNQFAVPKTKIGERHTGWSFCNLCEMNAAAFETEEDFYEAAKAATIIGTLQAGYTDFPYLGWVTEAICRREALLGIGMTGMMDKPHVALNPEFQRKAAEVVRVTNEDIALKIGIRVAARATCVKPSGTTSLELGCVGSGIHAHHASRYFRRVTANPNEAVFKYFRSINPHMCEQKPNGDWVITFPITAPEGAVLNGDLTAIEFLEKVLSTQKNWVIPGNQRPDSSPGVSHNVSNTVVVQPNEWDGVMDFIWENRKFFTGVSLLAASGDKDYSFAPREAVRNAADEARWKYLIENYTKVDYTKMVEEDDATNLSGEVACAGGACDLNL